MMRRVRLFRDLLGRTPVDEVQVSERPAVFFRVAENTWLEAVVRYLVDPRESGPVKARLLRMMLARLNARPDRVRFPHRDAR